jgi:hypothetical protein
LFRLEIRAPKSQNPTRNPSLAERLSKPLFFIPRLIHQNTLLGGRFAFVSCYGHEGRFVQASSCRFGMGQASCSPCESGGFPRSRGLSRMHLTYLRERDQSGNMCAFRHTSNLKKSSRSAPPGVLGEVACPGVLPGRHDGSLNPAGHCHGSSPNPIQFRQRHPRPDRLMRLGEFDSSWREYPSGLSVGPWGPTALFRFPAPLRFRLKYLLIPVTPNDKRSPPA